jgi:hypothetical protein
MPSVVNEQAPVPPPPYHRAQARLGAALHIDALCLVTTLHLLTLCRLAVNLAHCRCPPPLPAGPGGSARTYSEESLLLIALLRTLWRLSYADMRDWLHTWPALALACGLPLGRDGQPRIPSASQQWKRASQAGAPVCEALFVLSVLTAIGRRLIGARDLIIDSAPILAWRRADPDAAIACIPSSAVVQACPSFFCSLRPMSMMPRSLAHYWNGRCDSIRFVLTLFAWTKEELGKRSAIERFFGRVFLFFHLQRPPLAGWSTMVRQVALTYTATIIVALAAQQAGRPELIRSPKRVLAHVWEGF